MKKEQESPRNQKTKEAKLKVLKVEKQSAIVDVGGWRMRVHYHEDMSKSDRGIVHQGMILQVNYTGDISEPHSVKLQPIKKLK